MLPQRLDITLAFKAISISDLLSGTEKQVAAAIIDSFNFRTHQCDPSFDRIAHLVGKSRRTIIRAVQQLEKVGFLKKTRHGGHFHRNFYQPNWSQFRLLEAQWKSRRATRHWGSNVSPSTVPGSGHVSGDKSGTQTNPINQYNETSPRRSSSSAEADAKSSSGESNDRTASRFAQSGPSRRSARFVPSALTDSASAARLSAERRWNHAVLVRFRDRPKLYAQVVEAIDPALQRDATEAELTRKGAGLRHVLNQLVTRGLNL